MVTLLHSRKKTLAKTTLFRVHSRGRIAGWHTVMKRVGAILFSGILLGSAGCQTLMPVQDIMALQHENFAKTWRLYGSCRASQSYRDMVSLATQLLQIASPRAPWSSLLPPTLSTVTRQPVRLSVDPRALAADCTLWAAQNAEAGGQPVVAQALFMTVLSHYTEPEYAFYAERARRALTGEAEPALRTTVAWPVSTR